VHGRSRKDCENADNDSKFANWHCGDSRQMRGDRYSLLHNLLFSLSLTMRQGYYSIGESSE